MTVLTFGSVVRDSLNPQPYREKADPVRSALCSAEAADTAWAIRLRTPSLTHAFDNLKISPLISADVICPSSVAGSEIPRERRDTTNESGSVEKETTGSGHAALTGRMVSPLGKREGRAQHVGTGQPPHLIADVLLSGCRRHFGPVGPRCQSPGKPSTRQDDAMKDWAPGSFHSRLFLAARSDDNRSHEVLR